MKISREDVLRVAELAHLEFTEPEIEAISRQLDSILTYSEKLNELDTSAVEPMAHVLPAGSETAGGEDGLPGTPLREDIPVPCTVLPEILAQAPQTDTIYFLVPKVIDR